MITEVRLSHPYYFMTCRKCWNFFILFVDRYHLRMLDMDLQLRQLYSVLLLYSMNATVCPRRKFSMKIFENWKIDLKNRPSRWWRKMVCFASAWQYICVWELYYQFFFSKRQFRKGHSVIYWMKFEILKPIICHKMSFYSCYCTAAYAIIDFFFSPIKIQNLRLICAFIFLIWISVANVVFWGYLKKDSKQSDCNIICVLLDEFLVYINYSKKKNSFV